MADGSVEKFYVALPPHVESNIEIASLLGCTVLHQGQQLSDTSIPTLGRLYVDYLDALLRDARCKLFPKTCDRQNRLLTKDRVVTDVLYLQMAAWSYDYIRNREPWRT